MADQDGELNPDVTSGADGGDSGKLDNASGGDTSVVKGDGEGDKGGGEKGFTFKEDRADWLPRTRLNEVSGKLTKAEERAIAAETALASEQKRTRALAGLEPQDPKAEETESIKAALYQMFPQLKTLEGLDADQLNEIRDAAQQAQQATRQQSNRHAEAVLGELSTEVASAIGVDKLSESQDKQLWRAYTEEAVAAAKARPTNDRGESHDPTGQDFLSRHERGDKTLVKEFAKKFLGDWFEPARRSVTAAQGRRNMRPVPRGDRARNLPASGASKVNLDNKADFQKALLEARGQS